LAARLGGDPWLLELATEVLVWAGNSATAGADLWPLVGWAHRRAVVTDDWVGSVVPTVQREVDTVLAAMRSRIEWYERYVERPMGRKQPPVVGSAEDGLTPPLSLVEQHERIDARLVDLASNAVEALRHLLRAGVDEATAVADVVRAAFGTGLVAEELECPPHAGSTEMDRVSTLLADPGVVRRVVAVMREIVAEPTEFAH
jgi:hypothetical protein